MSIWDHAESTVEDDGLDLEQGVITFLPTTLAPNESPLTQFVPFRSLAPEERSCAAHLFDSLTPKQGQFVLGYVRSWRIADGVKASGLPRSTLTTVPAIRPLITLLKRADQAYALKRSAISRQRWLEEVQAIAFFDPGQLVDENGEHLPINLVPREARIALQVAHKFTPRSKDDDVSDEEEKPKSRVYAKTVNEVRVTPYEKIAALRMWGEAMDYLKDPQTAPTQKPIEVIFVEAKPVEIEQSQEPITNEQPDRRDSQDRIPSKTFSPF